MSYRIWQNKYGSDPSVVGASFQINGHPFTVIGVAPPGFYGAKLAGWGMPDFWLPSPRTVTRWREARLKRPTELSRPIGRVRPGAPQGARSQTAGRVPRLAREPCAGHGARRKTALAAADAASDSGRRRRRRHARPIRGWVEAAADRRRMCAAGRLRQPGKPDAGPRIEGARTDLCPRRAWSFATRLVRKALVESVLLAVIGGVFGIAVAYAGTQTDSLSRLPESAGPTIMFLSAPAVWPVLLFTLGVSILTGMLFGTAPAWMTSHADPVEALRGANRSVGGGRSWAQKSLVIAQAAMSLVLLSAAALLAQSLRNLEHQNFGFEMRAAIRFDQSDTGQLQARSDGAAIPPDRR